MPNDLKQFTWPEWETTRLIGRGSFGAVYEIQRDLMGDTEKAALKVISIPQNHSDIEELYSDGYNEESVTKTFQNHLKSILDEYAMMKKLNECVNIVNCDDVRYVQHEDGIGWDIFIKMELLTPLTKSLPAVITEENVIKIARDMCSALEMCKRHGVVHRDIKPQNIFLSPNGNYKLGDFGVAKTVEKTMGGTKIGTYKYMAPEVYKSEPYGSAADIYSLGLVLYWILNERRMPFMPLPPAIMNPGVAENARQRRFAGEQIPAPAHGSEGLKQIVLKACAYDPKDRYGSATEMLRDLKQLNNGVPVGVDSDAADQDDGTIGLFGKSKDKKDETEQDLTIGLFGKNHPKTVDIAADEEKEAKESSAAVSDQKDMPETDKHQEQKKDEPKNKKLPIIIGAAVVIVLLIFLLMRSCGSSGGEMYTTTEPSGTAALEAGESTASSEGGELVLAEEFFELYVGETAVIKVEGGNGKYSYESSDKNVVTVSKKGEMTAVGAGSASITVISGDAEETVTVTIQDYKMTLSTDKLSLSADATATLEIFGIPEDAQVDWSSDNKKVATVKDGVVTAIGEGSTTITATWKNGKRTYTARATVTVEASGVTLDTYNLGTLYVGESKTITANTAPAGQTVTWTSSNSSVATVSGGKVTAVGAGSTTIRAKITYAGKTYEATCKVTVTQPGVSLSASSASLTVGTSVTLTASTTPSGATVSWSSSNTSVATVSGGKVTGVAEGSATITAQITYGGKTYKAICSVMVEKPSISVTSSSDTITYAEREQDRGTCILTAKVNPDGGSISWKSSDTSVATVSGNGTTATVTAISAGTATITATYAINGMTVTDQCTVTVSKAASTLKVSNLAYSESGTLDSVWVSGTISSNYKLIRMEGSGTAKSNALGISIDNTADPLYFDDGVYTYELTNSGYFKTQYETLYNLYTKLAGILGADDSLTITVNATIYDSSGKSVSFTYSFILYGD